VVKWLSWQQHAGRPTTWTPLTSETAAALEKPATCNRTPGQQQQQELITSRTLAKVGLAAAKTIDVNSRREIRNSRDAMQQHKRQQQYQH
jgi:hypothetical protein